MTVEVQQANEKGQVKTIVQAGGSGKYQQKVNKNGSNTDAGQCWRSIDRMVDVADTKEDVLQTLHVSTPGMCKASGLASEARLDGKL